MIYSTRQTHLFAVCIRAAHFAPLNGQQIIIVEIYNRDGRAIGQTICILANCNLEMIMMMMVENSASCLAYFAGWVNL